MVERSFADALGIHAGDRVTLNGRSFRVAGVAVTAALPTSGIGFLEGSTQWPNPGLIWLTQAAARSLATSAHPLGYLLNLRLADPAGPEAFANRFTAGGSYTNNTGNPYLIPWQAISQQDGQLVKDAQGILLAGSWLLALLALGSLVILVGGRMAEQVRRVGLLKAVGATPRWWPACSWPSISPSPGVAAVAGRRPGAWPPRCSPVPEPAARNRWCSVAHLSTVVVVVAVALAVAVVATFFPAVRAARTSTVSALADAARSRAGGGWLIARSARLPVPLLLAVRVAARRPRRIAALRAEHRGHRERDRRPAVRPRHIGSVPIRRVLGVGQPRLV